MKSAKLSLFFPIAIAGALLALTRPAPAQLVAYDDAGNYLVTANWTNGANQGFGFTPWAIATNGPDFDGTYVTAPSFAIDSVTNILGTNYNSVFGLFANGPTDVNETAAFRGFANPLGTNTFKIQWGARGAGVTTTTNAGTVHGWCGFTLRNGNATNSTSDFGTSALLYLYFLDGSSPSTLYFWDGNGVQSVPGTSFSDLGRQNITNAIEAEVTPAADGISYHLILKDCVQNRTLFTTNSLFMNSGTVDSVALFAHETTGDQVYNRLQIAAATNIPPTVVNLQPANGAIFLDANATAISFEVDSFNSTVATNNVTVSLNGVPQSNLTFNTTSPASQLLVNCSATFAPDTFYTWVVTAQDANGNIVTSSATFNTFLASDLYIDCGDYNYTSGGASGLFVNSATPANVYSAYLGSNTIDYFEGDLSGTNNAYRAGDLPQVLSLNPDATGDPIPHAGGAFTIYSLGFTDIGDWENYTRVMPVATNYTIYARASSAAGGQFEIEELVNTTATTTNQPLAALGRINVPATGGSKVCSGQLTPLTDFFGNPVVVPLAGTRTLRQTALQSRTYNLEYLVLVAAGNSTNILRPYLATGSPVPNAAGVFVTTPISFTLANRQTSATTNTIQLFVNTTNVTSRLIMSSNAMGTTVTWTPTNNLPVNFTNTVTLAFTDSSGVRVTNSWSFITGTTGGVLGSGLWSGGGGTNDLLWSDGINWLGGTPGPGFNASFASLGATTNLVVNNIVATNATIQGLFYNTNNSGFQTTWIQDGVTLTVTNGANNTITAIVQVGGATGGDNAFNKPVTNTITGLGGTLSVMGLDSRIVPNSTNSLNFQVRQNATAGGLANLVTFDLSGLGTLNAVVGKFYVAQGGSGGNQTNVSGCVNLARTNIIACLRPNAGQFEVGDSSGGTIEAPGSTLNLGITNALFVDTMRFGKQKATNNLVRFNPLFTSFTTPTVFIRGTNGLNSRLTTWTIGDADTEATVPNYVQANVDFSGGKVDALVGTLVIGRGETSTSDSGYAQGTLTLSAGTLDALNVTNGIQRANNAATESGIINVTGTATLSSANLILAQAVTGASGSISGTLNVTNGTVRGNLVAGGGISTVNLSGGSLVVSNFAGTTAAPLSALNLTSAALHLKADGNATGTNIVAAAVAAAGTTLITIDAVTNVTGPKTLHLLGYAGTDPFASLALAPMPAGFTGSLVDNAGSIDLTVNVAVYVPPTFRAISVSGGQFILSGTNNAGAGGTYKVLTTTNLTLALTNWSVLTSGSFDASGDFSFTNATGAGIQRYFLLKVP